MHKKTKPSFADVVKTKPNIVKHVLIDKQKAVSNHASNVTKITRKNDQSVKSSHPKFDQVCEPNRVSTRG